jgi:hypothetical protein
MVRCFNGCYVHVIPQFDLTFRGNPFTLTSLSAFQDIKTTIEELGVLLCSVSYIGLKARTAHFI